MVKMIAIREVTLGAYLVGRGREMVMHQPAAALIESWARWGSHVLSFFFFFFFFFFFIFFFLIFYC